jgi:hypothetical protein
MTTMLHQIRSTATLPSTGGRRAIALLGLAAALLCAATARGAEGVPWDSLCPEASHPIVAPPQAGDAASESVGRAALPSSAAPIVALALVAAFAGAMWILGSPKSRGASGTFVRRAGCGYRRGVVPSTPLAVSGFSRMCSF